MSQTLSLFSVMAFVSHSHTQSWCNGIELQLYCIYFSFNVKKNYSFGNSFISQQEESYCVYVGTVNLGIFVQLELGLYLALNRQTIVVD